jgi:tRNA dimethylallyltransferase
MRDDPSSDIPPSFDPVTSSSCHTQCLEVEKVLSKFALSLQEDVQELFFPKKKRAVILAGPTGVGKTRLSLLLAKELGGEIVSADSAQVYRGMNIGTAKIDEHEREGILHHLIDIRDITEPFSVTDFYEEAKRACFEIQKRNKVPIVVGGTGFYLHALIYGPPNGPPKDEEIRSALECDYEKFGIEPLFERLQEFDPSYAQTIGKNDVHKVIRALEIIEITGRAVSSFEWKERAPETYFDFRPWFLYRDRKELYPILDARVLKMLAQGLLDEVIALDRQGIRKNSTASQAIGYKQTLEYLDSAKTEKEYKEYVERLQAATRHLAKRQFTWFRKEPFFTWLDVAKKQDEEILAEIIADYQSPR